MDPRAEMGLHDDWSYIYSAKQLADTGHVVYNGWATAMLGWQLYLGALFLKLFGWSFTVARASTVAVAMATAGITHAVLGRLGVRPWNAVVGTLTFVLSPVFLPLAASFMSDVPAVFCLAVCFYGCVRAVQAETDRRAVGWLLFAAVINLGGGTVRQIAWLGVLVMVPATAWFLRRRRGVLFAGVAAWMIAIAIVLVLIHWFNLQPYTSVEELLALKLTTKALGAQAKNAIKSLFTLPLLLLPVLLGFASRYRPQGAARRKILIVATMLVAVVTVLSIRHGGVRWMSLLLGDYLSAKGILDLPWMFGELPDIVPRPVGALIALSVFLVCGVCTHMVLAQKAKARKQWIDEPLLWLLGPFCAAYTVLVVTRATMFDRYLLPLEFAVLMVALVAYERRLGERLPAWCLAPLALLMFYGVAGTHDLFALTRARLAAANEIRASGVPRSEFRAGFEYDGWTQIELTGYVNEPRMHLPVGAYKPWTAPTDVAPECVYWFESFSPAIHARYELSNEPNLCGPSVDFAPVPYRGWLHGERAIYIVRVR
jgi:hypothetical protein